MSTIRRCVRKLLRRFRIHRHGRSDLRIESLHHVPETQAFLVVRRPRSQRLKHLLDKSLIVAVVCLQLLLLLFELLVLGFEPLLVGFELRNLRGELRKLRLVLLVFLAQRVELGEQLLECSVKDFVGVADDCEGWYLGLCRQFSESGRRLGFFYGYRVQLLSQRNNGRQRATEHLRTHVARFFHIVRLPKERLRKVNLQVGHVCEWRWHCKSGGQDG
ncbi:hypothetical protein HDK64DRAFT_55130 [Phyllosticta capitalensis]|uniref:Uncharacterized protein n=1 Tax=Phyllosticta capitalensis TaxID=121624 RepID=A0ABR1YUL9_9PEZI